MISALTLRTACKNKLLEFRAFSIFLYFKILRSWLMYLPLNNANTTCPVSGERTLSPKYSYDHICTGSDTVSGFTTPIFRAGPISFSPERKKLSKLMVASGTVMIANRVSAHRQQTQNSGITKSRGIWRGTRKNKIHGCCLAMMYSFSGSVTLRVVNTKPWLNNFWNHDITGN